MGVVPYTEDDLLPISALQHLAFCERQWALIHLEGVWSENQLTAEGRVLHERAHEPATESRGDVRIARSLRLRSLRLGLTGVADVVEFHRCRPAPPEQQAGSAQPSGIGIRLPGVSGLWLAFPVEYKRGRPKSGPYDEIQLCAQAICLEEMLGVAIPRAALFYGRPMRRTEVGLDTNLRDQTEKLARHLHDLALLRVTPPPVYAEKCESCSLLSLCMPRRLSKHPSVGAYIEHSLEEQDK